MTVPNYYGQPDDATIGSGEGDVEVTYEVPGVGPWLGPPPRSGDEYVRRIDPPIQTDANGKYKVGSGESNRQNFMAYSATGMSEDGAPPPTAQSAIGFGAIAVVGLIIWAFASKGK